MLGLIGAALAGGAQGAGEAGQRALASMQDAQQKEDLARLAAQLDEQKTLRVEAERSRIRMDEDAITRNRNLDDDETKRQRDIADIPRVATATANANLAVAPINAEAKVTGAVAEARGNRDSGLIGILADNERTAYDARAPLRAQQRTDKVEDIKSEAGARAAAETEAVKARGNDPAWLSATRKIKIAEQVETAGSRAQAALASYQLEVAKKQQELRETLAGTTDPTERATLEQRIRDISGTSTKSYAEAVQAADRYGKMASDLRRSAEDFSLTPEEKRAVLRRAEQYEREADAILQSVKGRQGIGSGQSGGAGAAPSGPWDRFGGQGGGSPSPGTPGAIIGPSMRPPAAPPNPNMAGLPSFARMLAESGNSDQGKRTLANTVAAQLPALEGQIRALESSLPNMSPRDRQSAEGRIATLQQDAQMMRAFREGNPSLFLNR